MALKSDRQRAFVLALLEQRGERNYTAAYRNAGYESKPENMGPAAWKLAHDERIQEALHEQMARSVRGLAPLALGVVEGILTSDDAKDADKTKVAFGVLDRAGLHATVEHRHVMELADDTAMLAEIRMLAKRNNLPLSHFVGETLAKTIEGEFVDITPNE